MKRGLCFCLLPFAHDLSGKHGNRVVIAINHAFFQRDNTVVCNIDVLRATSAICTAFHNGAERLIPVVNIDEANRYKSKGYLVGAERGGKIVDGFDFGNSPFSFIGDQIKGKTIVFTTTNGTRAIASAQNAYKVVIASFLNLDAICNWLYEQNREIVLLCAGWRGQFNLEDTLLAGAIVEQLSKRSNSVELSDSAIAAQRLYSIAQNDMFKFLANSSHRNRLKNLNLEKDIEYCLTPNQTDVIPVLEGDSIVKLT